LEDESSEDGFLGLAEFGWVTLLARQIWSALVLAVVADELSASTTVVWDCTLLL
jgi:hypothetical protein